jgi:hypothetical protein
MTSALLCMRRYANAVPDCNYLHRNVHAMSTRGLSRWPRSICMHACENREVKLWFSLGLRFLLAHVEERAEGSRL